MKKLGLVILWLGMAVGAMAQTERDSLLPVDGSDTGGRPTWADSVTTARPLAFEERPLLFTSWNPLSFGGCFWNLHEGLNGQIGAGVTVGWGRRNPWRGTSFFTDVSLLYAKPVTDRWTVAVGGTVSRFRFFSDYVSTASVTALANYQFNDRLSGTVYGLYTLPLHSDKGVRPSPLFYERCATVGAELNYRFTGSVTLGIGFHETFWGNAPQVWMPHGTSNAGTGSHVSPSRLGR